MWMHIIKRGQKEWESRKIGKKSWKTSFTRRNIIIAIRNHQSSYSYSLWACIRLGLLTINKDNQWGIREDHSLLNYWWPIDLERRSHCLQLLMYWWVYLAPVDSSKPMVTETALVKLVGHKLKKLGRNVGKRFVGRRGGWKEWEGDERGLWVKANRRHYTYVWNCPRANLIYKKK